MDRQPGRIGVVDGVFLCQFVADSGGDDAHDHDEVGAAG
jgi:hypothetical protein